MSSAWVCDQSVNTDIIIPDTISTGSPSESDTANSDDSDIEYVGSKGKQPAQPRRLQSKKQRQSKPGELNVTLKPLILYDSPELRT